MISINTVSEKTNPESGGETNRMTMVWGQCSFEKTKPDIDGTVNKGITRGSRTEWDGGPEDVGK
jgi:hypothetical protein